MTSFEVGKAREQTYTNIPLGRGSNVKVIDDQITGKKIAVPEFWKECSVCKRWMPPGNLTDKNGPSTVCSVCRQTQKDVRKFGITKKEFLDKIKEATECIPDDDCIILRHNLSPISVNPDARPGEYLRLWDLELEQ